MLWIYECGLIKIAGIFMAILSLWLSGFFSDIVGSVGVACPAPVPVPHLSLGGRTAFDSGDHTFSFGVGLSALGSVGVVGGL
ncbi:unnamed protein product [Brassica oleracea]|uniref:(rape) hypothetical protein n=1 Tax=Brassica napus TaxID=3708 RepID=A0A816JJX9_BRANA|nr:unnamed protein product [Brassica napus]